MCVCMFVVVAMKIKTHFAIAIMNIPKMSVFYCFIIYLFCAQADILLKKRKKRKRGSYACMLVVLLRVAQINIHIFLFFLCAYVSGGWFEFNISYVYLSYVQNLR